MSRASAKKRLPGLALDVVDAVVLLEQRARHGVGERGRAGRHADLAAAQVAGEVDHRRKLRAGVHPAGVEQRLVGHQQATGALLGELDRGGQMGVDALPVADQFGQLLAHALVHLDSGVDGVGIRQPDQEVGEPQVPLHEREHAVAVKRRADVGGGARRGGRRARSPRGSRRRRTRSWCRPRRTGWRTG